MVEVLEVFTELVSESSFVECLVEVIRYGRPKSKIIDQIRMTTRRHMRRSAASKLPVIWQSICSIGLGWSGMRTLLLDRQFQLVD